MANENLWNKPISRRDFIKIAGVAALSEAVIGTTGIASGLVTRAAFSNFSISRTIQDAINGIGDSTTVAHADAPLNIIDTMNPDRGEPFDLSLETRKIRPTVDRLTGGDKGIISYKDLLRQIIGKQIILWGEAHLNDSDKVALRETIETVRMINPGKHIVLALGRFIPEDNAALDDFIKNSASLSDEEAVRKLQRDSSYDDHWSNQDLSGSTDPGKQFRATLLMCRKYGIQLVGLGVDVGASLNINAEVDQLTPQVIELENRAANIILGLHQQDPSAIIFAQAGRLHLGRGDQGQGIPPKLEKLLSENQTFLAPSSPEVTVVQTGDTSFLESAILVREMNIALGESWDNHQNLLNNSAFAVVKPKFSGAGLGTSNEPVRRLPGADYLLVRYFNNAWDTLG